ncbi:MAG: bifunctional diguanylate cyclase/phosphodiesterase [Actinobacteria bacterium]|nr:bifunctional diguanylate cyclase/phosphodiesterase [Actinomycetota bacterium]
MSDGRLRATTPERWLSYALIASFVLYLITLATSTPGTEEPLRDLVGYNLPFALAVVLITLHARRRQVAARTWLALGAGLLAYLIGTLSTYAVAPITLTDDAYPIANALWLLMYPLAFAFLLMFTRRRLLAVLQYAWIDVGATILDATVLRSITGEFPPVAGLDSLYLLGDIALLVIVLLVIHTFQWHPPATWWLLAAALLSWTVADMGYFLQVASNTYSDGTALDVLWPLGAVLFGLAAYADIGATYRTRQAFTVSYYIPGLSLLGVGLVLAFHPSGPLEPLAVVAGLITLCLAVVRMTLAIREGISLGDRLRRDQVDSLTGLPNMRAMRELSSVRARGASLIVLDLTGFSEINHSLGHDAGDQLLVLVAERLRSSLRAVDFVTRLGGDEFGVLLSNTRPEAAGRIAENLISAIEQPVTINGVPLHVTACAGVASNGPEAESVEAMLALADGALVRAVADGPGLVHIHAGGPGSRSEERLRARADIRAAFDSGGDDFLVYYQPIVRLDDRSVFGVEALVRWRREGVILLPGAFIDDITKSGTMPLLTRHMIQQSLKELRSAGLPYAVAVNVAPELVTSDLIDEVRDALASGHSTPEQLLLEITEESLMRAPEAAALILAELRSAGIRIELDDFGTGWSGLSTLRDLSVDGLKIDYSFVSRILTDPTALAIVQGVATMAADLGIEVIYEGVEDEAVEEFLRTSFRGCGQGFAIARPMPIDDLVRWTALRDVQVDPTAGITP